MLLRVHRVEGRESRVARVESRETSIFARRNRIKRTARFPFSGYFLIVLLLLYYVFLSSDKADKNQRDKCGVYAQAIRSAELCEHTRTRLHQITPVHTHIHPSARRGSIPLRELKSPPADRHYLLWCYYCCCCMVRPPKVGAFVANMRREQLLLLLLLLLLAAPLDLFLILCLLLACTAAAVE